MADNKTNQAAEVETTMTSFRCPISFLGRADRIGSMLPLYGYAHQSRSGILRIALEYGLNKLEEELRNATPVTPPDLPTP